LLELDDEAFSRRFRNSPIKRAKRSGLQRNVCIALGNLRVVPGLLVCSIPCVDRAANGSSCAGNHQPN